MECIEEDFFLFIQHGAEHTGYIPLYTDPDPPSASFTYNGDSLRFVREEEDYVLRVGKAWPCPCIGKRGDPSDDGNINVPDVLAVANHILGIQELTGDAFCRGDCTGDSVINILDALSIANVILGILEKCPASGANCKPVVTPVRRW